jgi:hypothetical protein
VAASAWNSDLVIILLLLPLYTPSSAPNRDLNCIVLFTMDLVGRYRQPGQPPPMTMDEPLPASEGCGAAFSQDLENTIRHEVTYLRSKLDAQGVIKIHKEYNNARGKDVETHPTHCTLRNLPEDLSQETKQTFARLRSIIKLADTGVDR